MQIEYRLKLPGTLLSLNNDWPATAGLLADAGAVFFAIISAWIGLKYAPNV